MIQPHLPIRLPCYDLTPIIEPTFDCCLLAVGSQASGVPNFHGLTGGVYKARERIHRGMLIRDYLRFRLHARGLQPAFLTGTAFGGLLCLAASLPFVNAIVVRVWPRS